MSEGGQSGLDEWGRNPTRDAVAEAREVAGNGGARSTVVDVETEGLPVAEGTVELAVMQVDYTLEGPDEEPVIHLFGRTPGQTLEHVSVRGFRPYFYVPTDAVDEEGLAGYDEITGWERTDGDGRPYESIRGEPVTKVFARTPRDVGQIRDQFTHYEADILFPNRFLIDRDVTSGVRVPSRRADDGTLVVSHTEVEPVEVEATPRVLTFDIEVDDRSGFPEDGEEEIICIASHDAYRDEYVVWLYEPPAGTGDGPSSLAGYDLLDETASATIRSFGDEDAMLEAFLEYVLETDPDVMTGWNFDDFDAPYLLDRLERRDRVTERDLDYERLSRVGEVWRSNWGGPDIKGRVVFDLLYAYRRTVFSELDSYRLDAVGEEELGVGKERYAGDIGDLWERDPRRLCEYNLRDVELCVELDRHREIIPFWREVATFVGCKLEDATTPGDAVDMYVLHEAHGRFVLPSKGQQEGGEEFEGGAVFEPITGVRERVSVLDLKSLYPMCMVTINASPETKVSADYEGETYTAPTEPEPTHFRTEPDGIIREMVTDLLSERVEKKARRDEYEPGTEEYERYDRQQQSVKVIMNSLYGVSGWLQFRLYDKDAAAAITATGREVIRFTQQVVDELDYQVVYGDSVTGDRPVVVRDPRGRVRVLPIASLFERATAVPDLLVTADGGPVGTAVAGKERGRLAGWEALSVTDGGEPAWRPITQVIRHETDAPVVRLRHALGESVTTTDHSYVIERDGDLETEPPEAVEEPLRVPGLPAVDELEVIDLHEWLADQRDEGVHADGEWIWVDAGHDGGRESTTRMRRYVDVESEDGRSLVRLLAASLAGECRADDAVGATTPKATRAWVSRLRADHRRLVRDGTTAVRHAEPGDTGAATPGEDGGPACLEMRGELAAALARGFAGRSAGRRIPGFVFHLPADLQTLFLGVLLGHEGGLGEEEDVGFETPHRGLAAGLSMLLTQRGRSHELCVEGDGYAIRTGEGSRPEGGPVVEPTAHDGPVYDLSVEGTENFVDGVGGIVLHNTDSVMVELADVAIEDAIDRSFDIESQINERYDEFARETLRADEHRFEIEFEKLYRRFFQAGKKKRYAGHIVWKEGKDVDDIDITGFEYQRSDIAPLTKEVQHRVLEMVVREGDLEAVEDYVRSVIEEVLAGEVPAEEIAIPGGIGKRLDEYETDTAHVRGAKYANTVLGTNFQRGSKPKRVYLERVDPAFFRELEAETGLDARTDPVYGEFKRDPDVICFEYADQIPDAFDIDHETMLEKTLKGPIERILEALEVSWEEVKSGQEQTGLDSFA